MPYITVSPSCENRVISAATLDDKPDRALMEESTLDPGETGAGPNEDQR